MYSTTRAAEYTVPRAAYSVYAEDLDLDGDKDIVVGHNYNSQTEWSGVSILENDGYGEFTLIDSIFLYSWQTNIYAKIINNDEYPDIIGRHFEDDNQYIAILENNQGIYIPYYYPMEYGISDFVTGDIDNDNYIDIVVASHHGQFWGVLYNNGSGQFSAPEYHNVDYHPSGIACGDLNNDGRDDIVVCGLKLEVYLSYPNSFQYILVDDLFYMCNVKIADIDNDGDNDIIAADWGIPGTPKRILIYSNDGNCNFELSYSKWIDEAMAEIFVSDLNNDNYPDVIYNVSYSYPNSEYEKTHTYILYNNGDNTFADPINYLTYSGICEYTTSLKSFATDVDGNGLKDIITANYSYNGDNNINILFQDDVNNFVNEPQVGIDDEECIIISNNFKLSNYPNPFNPKTKIKFSIREQGFVELNIYDIKGQLVCNLIDKKVMNRGIHSVTWDGKNNTGKEVNSNVYLYRLRVGNKSVTKKTLLVR